MTARGAMRAALVLATGGVGLILLTGDPGRRTAPALASRSLPAGQLRLRSVRAGAGPVVVLLHGYGESLVAWRGVFDRLTAGADVIALDLPGFGLSSKPPTGYTTHAMAEAVLAALDAARVDRAILVGHSMGGSVAAAAALIAPARVRALILVDPAGVATPWPALGPTDSAAVLRVVAGYESLRSRFAPPHDSSWLEEPPDDRAYQPSGDPAYRTALAAVLAEFDFSYLTTTRIRSLRLPTLVIWGEYDTVFPPSLGRMLVDSLPSGRLHIVPRSWHRPHVERPAETAEIINAFLAEISRSPASH